MDKQETGYTPATPIITAPMLNIVNASQHDQTKTMPLWNQVGVGMGSSDWGEQGALVSPTGRPYKFRDTTSPTATEQPKFRPDAQLGQMPKNWGQDPSWASDPVLQQGFIFRPLDKGRKQEETTDLQPPAPPPVTPYPYSYGWPGAPYSYYPAPLPHGGCGSGIP